MLSNARRRKFDNGAIARVAAGAFALLRCALPQACVLCRAAAGNRLLCAACDAAMPRITDACPACALPSPGALPCGNCVTAPPPHAAALAAWVYAYPADRLVHAFKYGGTLALAEPLAYALADALALRAAALADAFALRAAALPDCIVAIPLSATRQRERGFNQATEIARRVARALRVPFATGLERIRDTPPQAELALSARAANLTGAFAANASFAGRSVAVVDDVMTSGATLAAAARALSAAGAIRVEAWAVARTLPPVAPCVESPPDRCH
jgi:ComF family protein